MIDFASGSGLVAIAAMKAGAASVLAADIDVFCEAAIGLNAEANGVDVAFTDVNLLDAAAAGRRRPAGRRHLLRAADGRSGDGLAGPGPRDRGERADRRSGPHLLPEAKACVKLAEYQVPTTRELEDMAVKRTSVWTLP